MVLEDLQEVLAIRSKSAPQPPAVISPTLTVKRLKLELEYLQRKMDKVIRDIGLWKNICEGTGPTPGLPINTSIGTKCGFMGKGGRTAAPKSSRAKPYQRPAISGK